MEKYVNEFTKENFAEMISLDAFSKDYMFFDDKKNNKNIKVHILTIISSNSSLRKIYDTYLDFYKKYYEKNKLEDFEIEKEIWFAKIAYQEKRKVSGKTILPRGFNKFLRKIYNEIYDAKKFRQFLEVLIAYHKFFSPNNK